MLKQLLCALCAILPLTAFAQSEELWGYSYDSEFSVAGSGGGDMDIAMWVPGDGELSGASITALNLPFASSDITNLSIWAVPAIEYAAASLPQKVYEQRVSGTMKGNAYNRVELSKPLEIPAEGFFIGYSFHTDYYYPICTAPGTAKDGLWLRDALFGRWYDYPELGVSAMQLFVTGMQLDTHKVDVLQAQTRKCEKGKQTKATITLVSNSQKPVESIGFNITVDDQIQPVTAILPQPIPSGVNQVGEVAVTFTAPRKPAPTKAEPASHPSMVSRIPAAVPAPSTWMCAIRYTSASHSSKSSPARGAATVLAAGCRLNVYAKNNPTKPSWWASISTTPPTPCIVPTMPTCRGTEPPVP